LRQAASEIETTFEQIVDETFVVVTPEAADYVLACDYLGQYETGLRAGDAFHLAIAANRDARMIYSLDRGFVKAGRQIGLPVRSLP
jgi:predicted nucleic acid-binding protein